MTTNLHRLRWAVRGTLALGVAASVAANVLHAQNNPISQTIAAWPPLALLVTVELISRVPVGSRWLSAARLLAAASISGIAAWVSYWHMVGVVAKYGETGASPYLMPISVDGLIVVASICLVEIGARIRATTTPDQATTTPPATAPTTVDTPAAPEPTTMPEPTTVPAVAAEPAPTHLIPAARFAAINHQATNGQPITADELAARMSVPAGTAAQLLTLLDDPHPARVNGTPVGHLTTGGAR